MTNDASSYTRAYVTGETAQGQLGFMMEPKPVNQDTREGNFDKRNKVEEVELHTVIKLPKLCSYNILIKQVACGEHHTHLLSQDGYVYSMGANKEGALGLGQAETALPIVTAP